MKGKCDEQIWTKFRRCKPMQNGMPATPFREQAPRPRASGGAVVHREVGDPGATAGTKPPSGQESLAHQAGLYPKAMKACLRTPHADRGRVPSPAGWTTRPHSALVSIAAFVRKAHGSEAPSTQVNSGRVPDQRPAIPQPWASPWSPGIHPEVARGKNQASLKGRDGSSSRQSGRAAKQRREYMQRNGGRT